MKRRRWKAENLSGEPPSGERGPPGAVHHKVIHWPGKAALLAIVDEHSRCSLVCTGTPWQQGTQRGSDNPSSSSHCF